MLKVSQVSQYSGLQGEFSSQNMIGLILFSNFLLKHALHEHDEGQLYVARHHLQDIRNIYVVLTGLIRRTFPKEF